MTEDKHEKSDRSFFVNWISFTISTLVIFASFSNTLRWNIEKFWTGSRSFYEYTWDFIYIQIFQESKFLLSVVGTNVISVVLFWWLAMFFIYLDLYRPKFFMKYKIQEEEKVDITKFWKTVRQCLVNQFVGLLCSVPWYFLIKWRGCSFDGDQLPTLHYLLFELLMYAVIQEIVFYYNHRILHHPKIYKHIHKIHHEWTASIAIASIYAHPLDHILSVFVPVLMGPLTIGSHMAMCWLAITIGTVGTEIAHSGYHLPFLPANEAHDFHHLKFTNCFGFLGFLDRLHGTNDMFIKTINFQRNTTLTSLKSAKELIPDDKKKQCKTLVM